MAADKRIMGTLFKIERLALVITWKIRAGVRTLKAKLDIGL
jgi:hypothetical protein